MDDKSASQPPAATEKPLSDRIDMNDPHLTEAEAVRRNLGSSDPEDATLAPKTARRKVKE